VITIGESIRVSGIVQGVGFRPFVWQLARRHGLRGQVINDAGGVLIEAWGGVEALRQFRKHLLSEAPPLARVEGIVSSSLENLSGPADFRIGESRQGEAQTDVSPDAATCPQCLAEIRDPRHRRYRYPFTNCTHCGPRLSIVRAIPYDRANTSMAGFNMCPHCQAEYDDPSDRRFHAQPNACPVCGPQAWLEDGRGDRLDANGYVDAIGHAAELLRQGHILAIKGIGGFHLACDAGNDEAVNRLRQRKHRHHKAFALMARDVDVIQRYADLGPAEETLLQDRAAPIVLLKARPESPLSLGIAPGQTRLGFLLPYTPLHHLLLQEFSTPIVMTSGNRSDEAPCLSNQQAHEHLNGIADFFLMHDREIVNRLDDSVARVIDGRPQLLRRARGYAPQPLKLPSGFENSPAILAMGAELKNTFCLIQQARAIVSQHQGDLEDATVFHDYRHNLALYRQLYEHRPEAIAVDLHPDYVSTGIGGQLAAEQGLPLVRVQHHHAHIAACMAEHGQALESSPVLGIALDGLGYGDDGSLWGGEFLLADYRSYRRLARFAPVPMPGGARAMLEPWRNGLAHLQHALGWEQLVERYPKLGFVQFMQEQPVANLLTMMEKGLNSPPASSAGRLFDAVAALLGICTAAASHEGQAAMELEALAEEAFARSGCYPYELTRAAGEAPITIQWGPFWQALLEDMVAGNAIANIAAGFHKTLLYLILDVVEHIRKQQAFDTLVLSGGVMQNQLLLTHLLDALQGRGYTVLIPRSLPANDGGISFGQAVVAAARSIAASEPTDIETP